MLFHYIGKRNTGENVDVIVDAKDRFSLAKELRQNQITPILIEEAKGKLDIHIPLLSDFLGRVKLHEKIIFTHNLAGMLTAGLSLYRALAVLQKQTTKKQFSDILKSLSETIDKGGTLSEGMQKYPNVFSTLFVSMVRAGEESGNLAGALTEIGQNLEKTYNLNKKIKSALMYPSIILCAIFAIGILMMIFVVPSLTGTFKELGVELPVSTRLIIFISDTLAHHTLLFLLAITGIVTGFVFLTKMKGFAQKFDFITLKLPVIGTIAKELNAARTARTLASLLSSGVPMTHSLEITGAVLQNTYYKKVIEEAIDGVQKGLPLSKNFKDHPELYPVMVGEMMEVGEETGKLSAMLVDIAVFYEGEVDNKTKDLSTIIEPVLMVVIGAAVGFFAVSMITPMYSILNTV